MNEKTRPKPRVSKVPNLNAWRIDWTDKYGVKQDAVRIYWPVAVAMALCTWDW